MPNYEEVQRMMQEARTPEERREAVEALKATIPPGQQGMNMVTMSKGGQNVVRLGALDKAAENPEVFERLRSIIKGK